MNFDSFLKQINQLKRSAIPAMLLAIALSLYSLLLAANNTGDVSDLLYQYKIAENDSARVYILVETSRFYSTSDLKQSIILAEKAIEIATKGKDKELISYALFNAGNAYFTQGMYEAATGYYYSYLDIQKQINHRPGIAYALVSIGAIRIKMQDFKTAKNNLLKGLFILNELSKENSSAQTRAQIPVILNNLGIVYQNLQQYDSALWYYRESLKTSEFVDDPRYFQASIYNNIGGLFLDNKNVDSAYASLVIAMQVRIERNDLAGQAASFSRLGEYYLLMDNPQKALEYFYNGLGVAKSIGSIDLQGNIAEKLYTYFKQAGQADSALKYYELHNKFAQELNNKETVKELTRLELQSEFREKQKIERLEQERLNSIYLFTALLLVLLLLVFVLLYFLMNNRLGRLKLEKNNLALTAQNSMLEKENFEKALEIRNKELSTHVMGMIRKNETIGQIVEVLSTKINKDNHTYLNQIIRDLSNLQEEKVWDEFEVRYHQVHNKFYENLQSVNPHLTTNERRLCAFLRLNMTTKDISSITGQSLRSIEVARTRLRKKLDITNSEVSLVEFLNAL